jgi:hypothetical protein
VSLEVEFTNVNIKPSDRISTKFKLVNKGSSNVKLSDVICDYETCDEIPKYEDWF